MSDLTRIVPPSDTTDAHVRPHFDGCPECLVRWNVPTRTRPTDGGCLSTYTCRKCRHEWTCSWACDGMG